MDKRQLSRITRKIASCVCAYIYMCVCAQAQINQDTLVNSKFVHISTYKRLVAYKDSLQPIALSFQISTNGNPYQTHSTKIIDGKFYPVRLLSMAVGEWKFKYNTLSGKPKEATSYKLAKEATHFIIVLREDE